MDKPLQKFLQDRLKLPEGQPTGKVMELSEAVRRFVEPGMSIQTGNGMAFPAAAYFEIARRFWGKDPGFTLIGNTGGAYNFAIFAHGRLCRRIISGFNGDGYPFPSPNPILTRAFQEGRVVPESWTYLTLTLRLMAGAMGVPFFATKSLAGSTMELENRENYSRAENPFSPGEKVGLLKALNPDIALAHGWAADPEGNTILGTPYSGHCYGALAAKNGVIVTVEKIVDADFIRRYSFMTKIPGYVVKAVCPAPFGAHPTGLHALGVPDFEGYGEDEEFILEARKASRDPDQYQVWLEKWVLGCKDQGEFLSRLGQKRTWFLMGRVHKDSWTSELAELTDRLPFPEEATPAERLVFGAAEKLSQIVKEKKYKLLLCGIGVSNLASWIAYYDLCREGVPLELVAEIGFYGYSPLPADPFIFNLRNLPTCRMISDIFTTLGIMMSGSQTWSIGVIGAGQVDRFGNVNTTKVSESGPYLVGSGGANDVASGASEIVVTLEQSKSRFVEKVPYITSPGSKVTTVISQLGILEKDFGGEELRLTAYFPIYPNQTEEGIVRSIREQCGWNLQVSPRLQVLSLPSPEDLKFIRCFDPKRLFLGGSEAKRE
jgi:acyl CoA:acetate/3-ketoacid CoA transferase alpha subunit/acyl CoA:acetate/3-ketoacid CoA transferase beta subunit